MTFLDKEHDMDTGTFTHRQRNKARLDRKDTTNKTRDSDKTCYTRQKGQIDRKG